MTKTGMMAIVCVVFAVLLAACSSSSDGGGGGSVCTLTGNYEVTFGAATGDAHCPDLTSQHPTYSYVIQNDGQITGPVPPNTTADSGNTFNESTCAAHAVFTSTATPAAGCDANRYTFDQSFSATGFSGTYAFIGCDTIDAKGTIAHLACNYPISGVKK